MPAARIILRSNLCPGDILMLTAAVRDLHLLHPGEFVTDVRTPSPALWDHNPWVTPLDACRGDVREIDCHYPLINRSNQEPWHFIHGYVQHLGEMLGLRLHPTAFHGDIHLSPEEQGGRSPVAEMLGAALPYWIIVAGGKPDYTIKWWSTSRFQEVVDHFRGRLLFVQTGESHHFHRPLRGVLNLVGKTSLRQFIRLMRHADGVLCPVTFAMHLAAAVPRHGSSALRPCVVVAGGREPPHWEAYPGHQFLHTVGMLPCCASGGCWKARTVPLFDGNTNDSPENRCTDVIRRLPHCMDLITPRLVIEAIDGYLEGGMAGELSARQAALALPGAPAIRFA